MAFAQLTYRNSLRDVEACSRSLGGKLYHMGFRGRVARSTLADANDAHDWRIYAEFAQSQPEQGPREELCRHSARRMDADRLNAEFFMVGFLLGPLFGR